MDVKEEPMASVSGSSSSTSRSSSPVSVPDIGLPSGTEAQMTGGSFLKDLSSLVDQAVAAPTPSGSLLDNICLTLKEEEQDEAFAVVVGEPELQAQPGNICSPAAAAPPVTDTGSTTTCTPILTSPVSERVRPPGTSWTWQYFRLPATVGIREASTVYCLLCGAGVKRGLPGKGRMGTTALSSHLACRHKIFKGQELAAATVANTTTISADVLDSTTTPTATTSTSTSGKKHRAHRIHHAHCSTATECFGQRTNMTRDDDRLYPPPDRHVYLGVCMLSCQYCGAKLSCGETLLEAVLQVVQMHMKRCHPDIDRHLAEVEKSGCFGNKRGWDDGHSH